MQTTHHQQSLLCLLQSSQKLCRFFLLLFVLIVFICFHSEQYLSTLALSHTLVEGVCRCRQYMIPSIKKCPQKSIQKYRHASRSDSSISTSPYAIVCGNHRFDVRVTPSPLSCKKKIQVQVNVQISLKSTGKLFVSINHQTRKETNKEAAPGP